MNLMSIHVKTITFRYEKVSILPNLAYKNHHKKHQRIKASIDDKLWKNVNKVRSKLKDLSIERDTAVQKANRYSMRSRRLTEAMEHLYMEAFQNVKDGNEDIARRRLEEKAIINNALSHAIRKASYNAALAAKLEKVIGRRQIKLLDTIRWLMELTDEGKREIEHTGKIVWSAEEGDTCWISDTIVDQNDSIET